MELPRGNDVTVLRNMILYSGNDPFYKCVRMLLLSPPYHVLYALARSKFKISRSRILGNSDCVRILRDNGKIAKCSRVSCIEIMTVWEGIVCGRCGEGPFHRITCISLHVCQERLIDESNCNENDDNNMDSDISLDYHAEHLGEEVDEKEEEESLFNNDVQNKNPKKKRRRRKILTLKTKDDKRRKQREKRRLKML